VPTKPLRCPLYAVLALFHTNPLLLLSGYSCPFMYNSYPSIMMVFQSIPPVEHHSPLPVLLRPWGVLCMQFGHFSPAIHCYIALVFLAFCANILRLHPHSSYKSIMMVYQSIPGFCRANKCERFSRANTWRASVFSFSFELVFGWKISPAARSRIVKGIFERWGILITNSMPYCTQISDLKCKKTELKISDMLWANFSSSVLWTNPFQPIRNYLLQHWTWCNKMVGAKTNVCWVLMFIK